MHFILFFPILLLQWVVANAADKENGSCDIEYVKKLMDQFRISDTTDQDDSETSYAVSDLVQIPTLSRSSNDNSGISMFQRVPGENNPPIFYMTSHPKSSLPYSSNDDKGNGSPKRDMHAHHHPNRRHHHSRPTSNTNNVQKNEDGEEDEQKNKDGEEDEQKNNDDEENVQKNEGEEDVEKKKKLDVQKNEKKHNKGGSKKRSPQDEMRSRLYSLDEM